MFYFLSNYLSEITMYMYLTLSIGAMIDLLIIPANPPDRKLFTYLN